MGIGTRHQIGTDNFASLPLVFIDIETTGDNVREGGEICEIGLVKTDPTGQRVLVDMNLKVAIQNSRNRSEDELSYGGYNGFNFAEWESAIPPELAMKTLNEFCTGCVPWAYNVSFEFRWLGEYFDAYELDWQGDYHWFDLMTEAVSTLRADFLARRISKLSLSSVGSYLGLAPEAMPHRGLAGARYEWEVYRLLPQR